ncbi:MAG TPA: hypothetical protein VGL91_24175 [Acidobacteriota bacterium]|jgi:hypothetical protein
MTSESYPPLKAKLRDFLVDAFIRFYTIKAVTRFSAALIGCPLRVELLRQGPDVLQGVVGDVKFAFFPADQDQLLQMHAWAEGKFSAIVFQPGLTGAIPSLSISRFDGRILEGDQLLLCVPGRSRGQIRLERRS